MARQQRAADKAQKRLQKKQGTPGENPEPTENKAEVDEFGQPVGLDFHDF